MAPCLHLVMGGRCRWCLCFPRHLSALPLLVVRGGALGWQRRMWTWVVQILWESCLHLEREEAGVGATAGPY